MFAESTRTAGFSSRDRRRQDPQSTRCCPLFHGRERQQSVRKRARFDAAIKSEDEGNFACACRHTLTTSSVVGHRSIGAWRTTTAEPVALDLGRWRVREQ